MQNLDEDMVPGRKLRWEEEIVLGMEHLDTVMVGLPLHPQDSILIFSHSCMSMEVCSRFFLSNAVDLHASRRILLGFNK